MQKEETEKFCPASRQEWRQWLQENHRSKQSVWLVCYKKRSDNPSIDWTDIVDEALCFGWVDGKRISVDNETFMQFLCKRKPKSTWSKINKAKVEQLIAWGLMSQAGLDSVELAKKNGSWTILDLVEELTIPKDLEKAFKTQKGSEEYFLSLSKSVRKAILQWLTFARRLETRQNRINEVAELAGQKKKPKQF